MEEHCPLVHFYLPDASLAEYIQYIWYLNDPEGHLKDHPGRLLPEGNIELVFDLGQPVFHKFHQEDWQIRPQAFICGLVKKYYHIKYLAFSESIGVVFKPGGIHRFFPYMFSEYSGHPVPLDHIMGSAAENWISRLKTETPKQKLWTIQNLLRQKIIDTTLKNAIVYRGIELIHENNGTLFMDELMQNINVSSRHLRRIFQEVVGISPKYYSKLIRIQALTRRLVTSPDKSLNEIWPEFGYYDQSHFERDFTSVAGIKPSSFFNNFTLFMKTYYVQINQKKRLSEERVIKPWLK
jgi:AraC-like DNA-binding protein